MSTSAELFASGVKKLFLRQGGERLEAIDALVRRLGADILRTEGLNLEGMNSLMLFGDEFEHQCIKENHKWVTDLDTYAKGYLPSS
ncbi:hypothetical protein [Streptomyces bottropensis]|uniref:hypothetical protein n=1 Tax=Streptomyces bottropensis TaxID=42235 RepID=UPI0036CE0D89